jgi:DNA polymerase-1
MRLVVDVETDGFIDQLTRIHIIVLRDVDSGERFVYRRNHAEDTIKEGLAYLSKADQIIGHNLISFDIPALAKVYGFEVNRERVQDTLVLSRLYFLNIIEEDFKRRDQYPKQLYGRQSIEAWGYRFGIEKVGIDIKDWSTWTQYMEDRCVSDVEVNAALWKHIEKHARWPVAEKLEHDAAWLCSQIERNGIPFDVDGAAKLYAELVAVRERLSNDLRTLFPCWTVFQGEYTSKANNSKTGHTKGAVYSKVLINEFNPQSRDHIANRLKAKYGWEPVRVH